MFITTDDVCPENLVDYWHFWEEIKKLHPELRIIAFVIANYKHEQNVAESVEFQRWFERNRDWVQVGVHGYDHLEPPEQERHDAEDWVRMSLDILRPFLPERPLYRPPGFQRTIETEPMLRRLGFGGVAYERRFRFFGDNGEVMIVEGVLNSHCSDRFTNPVTRWREWFRAR